MTYIEFFSKFSAENIISALSSLPDEVIYIGNNSRLMQKHIDNYEKVFLDRGHKIDFRYKTISTSNLKNAVDILSEIVENCNDCVFDITGGDEMLIFALGIVYAKYPNKHIQIHKANIRNNVFYDCDEDGITVSKETPALSIDENIRIHNGEVSYGSINENKTYKWNLTPDFVDDINSIWDICKENVRYWNVQIGILEAAEIVGQKGDDELTTIVACSALEQYSECRNNQISTEFVSNLFRRGLLTYFKNDGNTITISYKNEQVKKCLTKAGQALEMKVYLIAKNALDKNGEPVYDEALNGVVIDWDGEFHDENKGAEDFDTENEIDVLLMHDMVPVFISCKNGNVTSGELYKLNTVAERFGGPYSKKVLVATAISDVSEQGKYFRQRAKDMNITLIEKIQDMDDAELEKKLKNCWNN